MLIRERFKRLREEKKVSQLKLAEMAEMTNSHISRFENGKHDLTLGALDKLLRCLGSSPAELYAEEAYHIPVYEPNQRATPIDHLVKRGPYSACYGIKIREQGLFPIGSIAIVSPIARTEPRAGDIVAYVDESGLMCFERYRSSLHDEYAGVVLRTEWIYKR